MIGEIARRNQPDGSNAMTMENQRATKRERSEIRTINDVFLELAGAAYERVMTWQDEAGAWESLSSAGVYSRVRALALALQSWGIGRGDRVAILSENRWEWSVADFAVLALGAVDVPIYPTLTAEQIGALMRDSGARLIVVSTHSQYRKIASILPETAIERVVMMDAPVAGEKAESFAGLIAANKREERDNEFDAMVSAAQPDDLATLIYTSGTTGEPKGVMLTHGNVATNVVATLDAIEITERERCISYLPLPHIFERMLDYLMFHCGAQIAYCSQMERLPQIMKEIHPTAFVAVPRVYEKIRQGVEQKSSASPVKKRIFEWALGVGAKHRDVVLAGRRPTALSWRVADKLVYSKVKEAFGGCVHTFISGGAPLGTDTGYWFAAMGIAICEGYGLTETSPVLSINARDALRMGSVGKALRNIECRLAEDGELLVRGPSIFQGYWKKETATRECIDAEGWFSTGDIAQIDGDGFLFITDRKKELLKTSGGKLIAPQPIENRLKADLLVGNVAVVGDKHKFLAALISPNFAALEAWAAQHGIFAASRGELVANARVIGHYAEIVAQANAKLASFESIKRFLVVAEEWTLEGGELTPSMKLKRRVITTNYAEPIASLYADEATSHGG